MGCAREGERPRTVAAPIDRGYGRSVPRAVAVAFFALLGLASACTPAGERVEWSDPHEGPFVTGPYILLGGERNAFVVVKSPGDEPPYLEWWLEPAEGERERRRHQAAERYADLWIMRLDDLPAGRRIHYQVIAPGGTSDEHSFRAGPAPGEPFRIAAFGDTRTNHDVHRAVIDRMAREKIDFVVHTGDMVEYGGVQPSWDRFFQIERPLLTDTPIVPAIGNHDVGTRDYYRRYFLHEHWTGGRRYFVLDWGNLRILCLDIGVEGRDGSYQFAFAEKALAEGAARGMLMMISLHFPPYSSGHHGSQQEVQEIIKPLARRYGVELVVAGHDHNYERTEDIDGTTYVVSGSAGAPIRPVRPRWFTASARTEPHYVLLDVDASSLVLRAVNLQGDTFDTHVIQPNPPHTP